MRRDDARRRKSGEWSREPQEGEGRLRGPRVIRQGVPSAAVVEGDEVDLRALQAYMDRSSSFGFYCSGYIRTSQSTTDGRRVDRESG